MAEPRDSADGPSFESLLVENGRDVCEKNLRQVRSLTDPR